MTEATVHARIQTLLQALDTFDDADVSLHDYRILDKNASPPYAVIVALPFSTARGAVSLGQKTPFFWGVGIELYVLPKEDNTDQAEILTLTWSVVYKLLQYFTLNELADVSTTSVSGDRPIYIKTRPSGTKFLRRILTLTVTEKPDIIGGEYPS